MSVVLIFQKTQEKRLLTSCSLTTLYPNDVRLEVPLAVITKIITI